MQGNELKEIRKTLKLTQSEFGSLLDLTGGYIGEQERGEKIIDKRTALAALYLQLMNQPSKV